jgi:acetylornithine deacetylase/succinyl-diaminopimelate desuccinylase-like protein
MAPLPRIAGLAGWLIAVLIAPLNAAVPDSRIEQATVGSIPEFLEFLRLPNVTSISSADIRRNADWLEAAFRRHQLEARQLPDGDTPMLFAQTVQRPGRPTILFYAHMDGQPAKASEWDQPSPFEPVLKTCSGGDHCTPLPLDRLRTGRIDPEWRLFARSAADDKAPILMMIAALDALRASGTEPAINVKLLIDSHEEGGPPTLKDVVAKNAALLKADAVVMMDGPMHASNRPTIIFGHRGGGLMKLTVFGPRIAIHSGHYGNYAPDPAQTLAALIASFKDASGRVLVPGFYDGAAADFARDPALIQTPDDEGALRHRLGIAAAEPASADYRAAMAKPSLSVIGLSAGTGAELNQSIIPDRAIAAFDLRTVPGINFARQVALIRAAMVKQGFHIVDQAPTEEERAHYPLMASLLARDLSDPLYTSPSSPVGRWALRGLGKTGRPTVTIPMMGGSVPSGPFVFEMKVPTIVLPLVNADDNQHGPNENLRMGNYSDGVRALVALLSERF